MVIYVVVTDAGTDGSIHHHEVKAGTTILEIAKLSVDAFRSEFIESEYSLFVTYGRKTPKRVDMNYKLRHEDLVTFMPREILGD